jgi:hypothetical protein
VKGISFVLTLAIGAFLAYGAMRQVSAQEVKRDKLDCSGRWTLETQPKTPLELDVANARRTSIGAIIQGGDVDIEHTDQELKIRQGPRTYAIALDGSQSRNVVEGYELVSTVKSDPDTITLVTRRVANAKVQTTQVLTITDGQLIVRTSPPFLAGSGTPPDWVRTATLKYKKR